MGCDNSKFAVAVNVLNAMQKPRPRRPQLHLVNQEQKLRFFSVISFLFAHAKPLWSLNKSGEEPGSFTRLRGFRVHVINPICPSKY